MYLLEAGLSHPEFLSEGSGRMKKSNQLIQKLMEHFYDFIIPGKSSGSVDFVSSGVLMCNMM